jgi:uncharacterized membrane protein required for colicin V production
MMDLISHWFDVVVAGLLILGFFRGRKRGMSMELLPVLQVLIAVVAGSQVYKPLGDRLSTATSGTLGPLSSYVLVYVAFTIIVYMIFSHLRSVVGEKLVGSDVFGRMEYYFGMLAGIIRYGAVILWCLALMNASEIDHAAYKANQESQRQNFGKINFPTPTSIQIQVFEESAVGRFARDHLAHLLIEPTKSQGSSAEKDTLGKQRTRDVDDIMNGGPSRPK